MTTGSKRTPLSPALSSLSPSSVCVLSPLSLQSVFACPIFGAEAEKQQERGESKLGEGGGKERRNRTRISGKGEIRYISGRDHNARAVVPGTMGLPFGHSVPPSKLPLV